MITFDPRELAALDKRLQEVAEKLAKRELRKAARKAMNIVKDDAHTHAPEDTGLLEENFALQTRMKRGEVVARVGIKGGAKKNPDTPYYFRMVEFGTEHMPAHPFMRPALERNAQAVFDTVVTELRTGLDKL